MSTRTLFSGRGIASFMRIAVARPARLAVLVLALTLLATSIPPQRFPPAAKAAVPHIFDQFPGPITSETTEVSENNRLAQSFVASDNYLVTEIRLYIRDIGAVNLARVTLMSDIGPPGPDLPLTNSSAQGLTAGVEWVSFILTTPWSLNASSTYWMVLDSSGQQNQGYEWWKRTSDPMYPNGMAATCAGGGCTNWNIDSGTDYLFIIIGIVGPSVGCSIDVDSTSAGAGDPLNYTVHYDNNGSEYASIVWMNISLTGYLIYVTDNSGSITSAPNWTFYNVDVGKHSFNMTGKVGRGVFDGYILKASLTLQYADRFGNLQEDHSCEAVTTARVPSLSFSKTVSQPFTTKGGNLMFALSFTNSGSRAASKVWVNDTVPDAAIYSYDTAANGTGPGNTSDYFLTRSSNLNIYIYEFGNVSPGVYRFEMYVTIRLDVKNGSEIDNRATLNYTDSSHQVMGPIWASAVARVMGASIHVRQFVLDPVVAPYDSVHYQITFNNEGTAQSALTWINSTLPIGAAYQTDTANRELWFHDGWVSGRTHHYNFTNLPPGPHSFIITVVVDSNVVDGQILTSSVCLAYTDWDSSLLTDSCGQSSAIVMIPTMTLEVTGDSTGDPGDSLDYQVYVNNSGSGTARTLWVNVTWDANMIYYFDNSNSIGGNRTSPETWRFDNVKPGNILWTFIFKLKAGLDNGHIVTTNYDANYTDYRGRPLGVITRSISSIVTAPIVRVDIIQNKTRVPRNDLIVYTIFFNNTGNGTAGSVWINDTIPELAEFKSSSDQYVGSSGVRFTWRFGAVAPGSHSMTVTVRVDGQAAVDSLLLNSVEMQYEDANGNFVGQGSISVSAQVIDGTDNNPNGNPPTLFTNLLWILVIILVVVLTALWLFVSRKFYGLGIKNKARIDELFLLHRSGELIRHHSRSLRPDVDSDVLSAMLVAVQNFVKESFKFRAGDLEELKFGDQKIVLINGQHVIIAAVVSGPFPQRKVPAMRRALDNIEGRFGLRLEEWSGLTEDLPQIDDILSRVFQNGNER